MVVCNLLHDWLYMLLLLCRGMIHMIRNGMLLLLITLSKYLLHYRSIEGTIHVEMVLRLLLLLRLLTIEVCNISQGIVKVRIIRVVF